MKLNGSPLSVSRTEEDESPRLGKNECETSKDTKPVEVVVERDC